MQISDTGILIEASEEISVQFINQEAYTTDGMVIFPDDVLGTLHYAVTWFYPVLQVKVNQRSFVTLGFAIW